MPVHRVDFLGCPVDNLRMEQAVANLEDFIFEGKPKYVAVINANKLWLMERDPRVAEAVGRASLFVPEKAIVIGSRVLGLGLRHHVGGIMLLKTFLPRAEEKGYRLYFLGAKAEVLELMICVLRQVYPRLQIVGWHHGYLLPEDDCVVRKEILQVRPDVLFVAMGSPKQEFWITEHLAELGVPVCMGVGGSFDVLAGIKRDTPDWIRALAMEWFYRLTQDPKNLWRRYLITIPWFVKKVIRARTQKSFPGLRYGQS
jgi:N-acetylglucosaminyldiphosphoundecaprenol N-acetyl-beta-D-mannosaminyltransferase